MSTGCAGTASSRPRTIARARKRLKDCGYEPKIAISGSEIAGKRGRRVGRLLHVALCLAKLSSGTNQPNGEGLRGQPRTMLRRAIPSFTVEVQRRPRLATTSNPDVQSSETKPPQAAFDRASDRAAAAAFGANMDSSPVDVAPSPPRGRILPSLVPYEPRHRLLEDAPVLARDS